MKKQLLFLASLMLSISSMAQSVSYLGKTITYIKKADTVFVTMNDSKKTVLKFSDVNLMPTAVQVLAAYKKSLAVPPVVAPPVVVPPITAPPAIAWTIIGNGSGTLEIVNQAAKFYKIKKGNYSSIYLNALKDVVIDGSEVTMNKDAGVEIGTGDNVELYGLNMTNGHKFRAIQIKGYNDNLKLHDIAFKDVKDYTIASEYQMKYVAGNAKTAFNNWKFERLSFDNCNTPFSGNGSIDQNTGVITGMYFNFKFINSTIKNCGGSIVWLGASEGHEIANNIIDSQNLKDIGVNPTAINGTHNRMLDLQGFGSIHDNKVTNSQGNFIGIRNFSLTGADEATKVYNNVYYNSWKYSAFEIQPWYFYEGLAATGKLKYSDVYIYNNTVGHLNTSKDWEGQILDLYTSHAKLYFYNNLGFDLNRVGKATTDMINYNGNSEPIVNPNGLISEQGKYYYNNKYFGTWQEAVTDLTSFKSKFEGVGAQK